MAGGFGIIIVSVQP